MKTIFIIIDRTEKFDQILNYSNFVNKDNEKYFILCANDITNEIKNNFVEKNYTFFRNTLQSKYLNNQLYISTANSIYASILFATKILEKNDDFSSNIFLFTKIQNKDHVCSFKYLFDEYKNIKYLYTRY
jgi:hypothetical protein